MLEGQLDLLLLTVDPHPESVLPSLSLLAHNVRTAPTEAGFTLTVEDHGAGIPAADVDRVTRPFVRLDPARGGNAHCGLGLAIVDRLVRHLGGELTIGPVAADASSPGFRVTMRFPEPAATA